MASQKDMRRPDLGTVSLRLPSFASIQMKIRPLAKAMYTIADQSLDSCPIRRPASAKGSRAVEHVGKHNAYGCDVYAKPNDGLVKTTFSHCAITSKPSCAGIRADG
ncbi:hypothetical protein AJ80_01631 [Polytolypa hystricis UAMH7299]|uniref:Uncharacterized protein n=1 Tax=Polytolypa hystricis (strain UAMH7299) TaxID=1447883 RepID=A0A2B7YZC5_POLH7|nr:hypothetical protein AJ80_01631 [Polytolypa hystricis UAMH7299]